MRNRNTRGRDSSPRFRCGRAQEAIAYTRWRGRAHRDPDRTRPAMGHRRLLGSAEWPIGGRYSATLGLSFWESSLAGRTKDLQPCGSLGAPCFLECVSFGKLGRSTRDVSDLARHALVRGGTDTGRVGRASSMRRGPDLARAQPSEKPEEQRAADWSAVPTFRPSNLSAWNCLVCLAIIQAKVRPPAINLNPKLPNPLDLGVSAGNSTRAGSGPAPRTEAAASHTC